MIGVCLRHQIVCPVCRDYMGLTAADMEGAAPPLHEQPLDFVPDESLLQLQRDMAAKLETQKQNGGVIDLEAERKKYLLSEVRARVTSLLSTDKVALNFSCALIVELYV